MTAKSCCDMFAKKANRVSANYCIGSDNKVALSCPESDRSWCSSSGANDHRAITIEVASDETYPYTVKTEVYNTLLDLVTDICKRNGITKLIWSTNKADRVNHNNGCNMTVHRDYANKACPGEWLYSRMGTIAETVNKRLAAQTATKTNEIWRVQVGAFSTQQAAENYAKQLKSKYGLDTIVLLKDDINNDGKVNIADSQALLNKVIGK